MKKHFFFLLFLIFLGLFAMKTLKGPNFFDGHDSQAHIVRLYQYNLALKDGQFPPRWAGGLLAGRGYPVFTFAYQLPYAIAESFYQLGLNLAQSLKLTFVLSYLFSSIFMYFFASKYWKSRWAGFLSAILWSWAPPIFEKIFIAGALGAVTSFTFIPLTFLCLYNLIQKPNFKNSLFLSFSTAFWCLSHLLTPIIFSPVLIIFLILQLKQAKNPKKAFKFLIISGLLAFGLVSWFIIPIIFEMKFTHFKNFVQHAYQNDFVSLKRLLYSKWGTHPPGFGDNSVSQQVGAAQWLTIGLTGLFWLKSKKNILKNKLTPFLITFPLSIFLMLKISIFIWDLLIPLQNIGTPWRFLSLAVFTAAVSAGYLIKKIKNKYLLITVYLLLLGLTFYGNRNHLRINEVRIYDQKFFDNYKGVATGWNEHLPIWIKKMPKDFPKEKVEVIDENCHINNLINKSNLQSFTADCDKSSIIQINTAYYPGWKIVVNNKNITSQAKQNLSQSNGMIQFSLNPGQHQVIAQFQDTSLRQISKFVSFFTLSLILFLCFKSYL